MMLHVFSFTCSHVPRMGIFSTLGYCTVVGQYCYSIRFMTCCPGVNFYVDATLKMTNYCAVIVVYIEIKKITEVKQHRVALVLGWVTAWEYAML